MSSSRRIGGEINILAMLDGQAGKPRRFRGLSRAAWYGGGAVLACALFGAGAWMLHEQADGSFEGRVATGPAVVPLVIVSEPAAEPLPNPPLQVPGHATAHATAKQAYGAAIVDLPAPASAAPPPVVTVAPAIAAPPSPMQAAAALPAPVPVQPVAKPAAYPAFKPAPRNLAPPRTAAAHGRPEPSPAHPRRTLVAAKPKPAPAAVDTDVALISAIIQHVNQHGEVKDSAGCGDKSCQAKMTNRP